MAKEIKKEKSKKLRPANYDEKLAINGSFIDIMKASVKNANDNSAKKKK